MHEADALFEGIALDWKERSNPNDSLYVETRFKVLRSWSGDLPEIIRVHTQFLQCELGKTYRIAAYKGEDGALQTNFCVQFHVDQIRQLNWEASVAVFNRVEVDD